MQNWDTYSTNCIVASTTKSAKLIYQPFVFYLDLSVVLWPGREYFVHLWGVIIADVRYKNRRLCLAPLKWSLYKKKNYWDTGPDFCKSHLKLIHLWRPYVIRTYVTLDPNGVVVIGMTPVSRSVLESYKTAIVLENSQKLYNRISYKACDTHKTRLFRIIGLET